MKKKKFKESNNTGPRLNLNKQITNIPKHSNQYQEKRFGFYFLILSPLSETKQIPNPQKPRSKSFKIILQTHQQYHKHKSKARKAQKRMNLGL